VFAVISFLISTMSGTAAERLDCRSLSGKTNVSIVFNSKTFNGQKLNCISGDFISDLTPCAPNGGFSLSSPTGAGEIVSVVKCWQDYTNHLGGISNNFSTETAIRFSGGFNSPKTGYNEFWSFEINSRNGDALLAQKGKPKQRYICIKK
jgi:hypothetical protein